MSKLKQFISKIRNKAKMCILIFFLFETGLESLVSEIMQEKEIKDMIGKLSQVT